MQIQRTPEETTAATRARTLAAVAGTHAQAFERRSTDAPRGLLGAIGSRFERRTWTPPSSSPAVARSQLRELRRRDLGALRRPDATERDRELWVQLCDAAEQLEVRLFVCPSG